MIGLNARTRAVYLPTREDRKADREADEALSRSAKVPAVPKAVRGDEPEYASVEALAEHLYDDEREEFTFEELGKVAASARLSPHKVRAMLEAYGLRLAPRLRARDIRGITSNDHNLWAGSGNCGGGSGIAASTPGLRFGK